MGINFDLDIRKCSSCGACVIACIDQNDTDIASGERSFRFVFRAEEKNDAAPKTRDISYYSVACMHCEDAPCVLACPAACIFKDPETNLTLYDNTNCIGCHSCALACPFGAPAFGKDGKMQKCDGCIERIRNGLIPACVRVCPTGALQLVADGDTTDIKESLQKQGKDIQNTSCG